MDKDIDGSGAFRTIISFGLGSLGPNNYLYQAFMHRCVHAGHRAVQYLGGTTYAAVDRVISALAPIDRLQSGDGRGYDAHLLTLEAGLDVYIQSTSTGEYLVMVGGALQESVSALMRSIGQLLPPVEVKEPNVVQVRFWAKTALGPNQRLRQLTAPDWHQVRLNYPQRTRGELERLVKLKPSLEAGRLILWHGEPGTGKTWALRSLAYEWRRWCQTSVVVDPENFFGDAGYMMSVVLDSLDYDFVVPSGALGADDGDSEASMERPERWHLLVMEDADEFLAIDAKQQQGQAMSRLLNMADGLIGQGLNLLLLITTNEPIEGIHRALSRSGRCLAQTEFWPLSKEESAAWLTERGLEPGLVGDATILADLYRISRQAPRARRHTTS